MKTFVKPHSIVRKIWGSSDTILFIFAGAAAEFALNKAVDWLYFTGKLPKDPLGRLFSTVGYAKAIVFSNETEAKQAIELMNSIHGAIETKRGKQIPDWAYRDVLFMLIDYSIRAHELLESKLSTEEKEEVISVFTHVGRLMHIPELPDTYESFELMRTQHLETNLRFSDLTSDLYKQYRKHLGWMRYRLLKETQILLTPSRVRSLLGLRRISFLSLAVPIYKISKTFKADHIIKSVLLPSNYKDDVHALNYNH